MFAAENHQAVLQRAVSFSLPTKPILVSGFHRRSKDIFTVVSVWVWGFVLFFHLHGSVDSIL